MKMPRNDRLLWQRVRESNPCTSLESAVTVPRVRIAVPSSLLGFALARAALRIALHAFLIVVRIRAPSILFPNVLFVDARQSLARAHPRMILRAILAFFPLAICILVVVLAYRKTRDR